MIRRLLLAAVLVTVASTQVVVGAGFPVAADDLTLVRVPGTVPEHHCTLAPVADTYLDEELPETVFGTEPFVAVASGPADRRALVRFDIGSCGIPAGAELRAAHLRAVLADAPAQDRTWRVQRVTGEWHEADATWATGPAVAPIATDTAPVASAAVAGTVLELDVRADVALVVAGDALDRGWRIADADEELALRDGGALASREEPVEGARPSLTIRWFD